MANLNFAEEVRLAEQRINTMEEIGGKGLMMPNNPTNSGSRKIMHATQIEHVLPLLNAEPALLQSGYENRFGEWSSAFCKAKDDFEIIAKISKFSFNPDHHYYLIIQNKETLEYGVIERIEYNHITESYGYLYDNRYLDNKTKGSTIKKDDTYKKSISFDDHDNRQDGVNLLTTYLSCEYTKEDGIIVSRSATKKLASPLLKKIQVVINDNDIPLNICGDENIYKSFANVGEEVKDGILFGIRREKKEESLFTQSIERLRQTMMSDDIFSVHGKVVDINIYCNNPESLEGSYYNSQLKFYYDEHVRFIREFCGIVGALIIRGAKCSYDLQKMYHNFKMVLEGAQYIKDKPFSNTIIEFIVLEESVLEIGDKISNRYGGKGVVSKILEDEEMPQIENGEYLDVIFNSSTCVNRENAGQLFETSLNHTSSKLIDYVTMNVLHFDECVDLYLQYLRIVVPEQAAEIERYLSLVNEDERVNFINSIASDKGIMISMKPLSESMSINQLAALYDEFPEVKQYRVQIPQVDSMGNLRYIETRRPLVVGRQYIYRLKQYAEEKFSAVSLSATNIRNENSRNSSKKSYKSIYAKTPIRFGEMETGDLIHLGAENVIINLMLHSSSPHARRLAEELLTGDPFDIDIKLDDMAKNRSVEILNVYLLTMGIEFRFDKIPKKKQKIMLQKIMTFMSDPNRNPNGLKKIMYDVPQDEYFDPDYLNKCSKNPMMQTIMTHKK